MSNTKEQPHWPKCIAAPSTHVTCANNTADLELFSHCKAQVATWPPEIDSALAPGGRAGSKCTQRIHNADAATSSAESDAEGLPKKKKK